MNDGKNIKAEELWYCISAPMATIPYILNTESQPPSKVGECIGGKL
jgi:hypothetical protein